jgi:hypothetical protein
VDAVAAPVLLHLCRRLVTPAAVDGLGQEDAGRNALAHRLLLDQQACGEGQAEGEASRLEAQIASTAPSGITTSATYNPACETSTPTDPADTTDYDYDCVATLRTDSAECDADGNQTASNSA